uniref:C-type lectin domain-containing protein n=1 Tax=Gallus gallus TaxID=9031 RepID=A0A8V0XBH5_CHICK
HPMLVVLVISTGECHQAVSAGPHPTFPAFGHACPNAWVGFQGKCYYLLKEENDWNSSREHCSAHGASLATIGSEEEMVRWGHEPKALGKAPGWGDVTAPHPSRIHLGDIRDVHLRGQLLCHGSQTSFFHAAEPSDHCEPEMLNQ